MTLEITPNDLALDGAQTVETRCEQREDRARQTFREAMQQVKAARLALDGAQAATRSRSGEGAPDVCARNLRLAEEELSTAQQAEWLAKIELTAALVARLHAEANRIEVEFLVECEHRRNGQTEPPQLPQQRDLFPDEHFD